MICAGIDLGGTGIKAALVDERGRILRKKTIPRALGVTGKRL